MRSIQDIKKGMQSKNQDDWITFDELYYIIEKAERYEKTLKDIMINCDSPTFRTVAKLALNNKRS